MEIRNLWNVAELIKHLQTLPPEAVIGVRSGCCRALHAFRVRRYDPEEDIYRDNVGVVIDADE